MMGGADHGVSCNMLARLYAVDTTGQRGAMRVRDEQRNEELRNRFEHLAQILSEDTAVLGAYRESREEMTSFEFWRRYLEEAKR